MNEREEKINELEQKQLNLILEPEEELDEEAKQSDAEVLEKVKAGQKVVMTFDQAIARFPHSKYYQKEFLILALSRVLAQMMAEDGDPVSERRLCEPKLKEKELLRRVEEEWRFLSKAPKGFPFPYRKANVLWELVLLRKTNEPIRTPLLDAFGIQLVKKVADRKY